MLVELLDAIKMFNKVSGRLEAIAQRFIVRRGGNLDELESRVRQTHIEMERRARARDSEC